MSLIDTVLSLNGGKMYDIWAATEKKNASSGSKVKTYEHITSVLGVIQPPNANGLALAPTADAGDRIISDLIFYCKHERKEKERVFVRGSFYEIRTIDYYDNGILKFYKNYLVKVDNQNA